MNLLYADALTILAAVFIWRGLLHFRQFLKNPEGLDALLWLARAGRALIVAIGLVLLAAGIWLEIRWLVIFGIVFLAEEIYETGLVIWIVRWGKQQEAIDRDPAAK